jgi:hypothetical protein
MTGPAKQSIAAASEEDGLLRRFRLRSLSYGGQVAPKNDEGHAVPACAKRLTTRVPALFHPNRWIFARLAYI